MIEARPAQLGKLQGSNYQHKFDTGRKRLFLSMWRFRCSMEEILEQLLI